MSFPDDEAAGPRCQLRASVKLRPYRLAASAIIHATLHKNIALIADEAMINSSAKRRHAVFVPGLMGSTLLYRGPGPFTNIIEEPVWSENLPSIWDTLASTPERLVGALQVTGIVNHWNAFGLRIDLYGSLLANLSTAGFDQDRGNLTVFGYDWRQDNLISAAGLLETLEPHMDKELLLIGHSMGCLVTRLALAQSEALRASTSHLLQLGPPSLGSARAYETLKGVVSIEPYLDRALKLRAVVSQAIQTRLALVVTRFDSIYQLLPPIDFQVLTTIAGAQYSAVHDEAWPVDLHEKLQKAREVHAILKQPFPRTVTLCGIDHRTPLNYMVDHRFNILREIDTGTKGDGTVTVASASHLTPVDKIQPVSGKMSLHNRLARHPDVASTLKRLLA